MSENKTITMSTKEMPDIIHDAAVKAKEKTKERIQEICSFGSPSNISALIHAIEYESAEIQLVLSEGNFSWDARRGAWTFFFPATREIMKMIGTDGEVKLPRRNCLRINYVEEERRGIEGTFRSTVTKTIVWGK